MGRILKLGMSGPDVRAVQDALNFHVRRAGPLAVDGQFGPKTEARVRMFQTSNRLQVDGHVGPRTEGALFEVTEVPLQIGLMPRLQLTLPRIGPAPPRLGGIGPLIPPLQLPGTDLSWIGKLTVGPKLSLPEATRLGFVMQPQPFLVLNLKLTVPTRKDPLDPALQTFNTLVGFVNQMPVHSQVKAFLLSQIPNPVKKIEPPGTGFKWGVEPVFDPTKPTVFGVKGNAEFNVRVTSGNGGKPQIFFSAWGDGKAAVDLDKKQGESLPRAAAEGEIWLGFRGVF